MSKGTKTIDERDLSFVSAFSIRHPRSVIVVVLLITVVFGWHARRIEINNSMYELLPARHPAISQDREVKQLFDTRESLLIGILRDDGIFRPSTLSKVEEITDAVWEVSVADDQDVEALGRWSEHVGSTYGEPLAAIAESGLTAADRGAVANLLRELDSDPTGDPGLVEFLRRLELKLSPISDVVSLADVENVSAVDGALSVNPPMEDAPATMEGALELSRRVMSNEMFVDGLVSRDATGTLVLAELSFHYDDHMDIAHATLRALDDLIAPYRGPETIVVAGVPMVNVYMSEYMSHDLARLTPAVMLVVTVIMYVAFRSLWAALIPLSVVLASLVWTLGLMAIIGRPITLVVSAMPVMLIAIGIADGVHIINEYRQFRCSRSTPEGLALATMQQLSLPITLTSLTTIAGFASLSISELRSIEDFGLFTSFGVFAAMVFSLTVIPALLEVAPPWRKGRRLLQRRQGSFAAPLLQLGAVTARRRTATLAAVSALLVAGSLALTRLEVGSTMVGYFMEDSEISHASEIINAKFGGTEVLDIVVDTRVEGGLKAPVVLDKIARLQDALETLPTVGYTSSLADFIKRINFAMHDEDESHNRIPGDFNRPTDKNVVNALGTSDSEHGRDLIAQYLLLYESAGGQDLLELADYGYQKAHILAQIRTDDTPKLRDVRDVADAFARANFNEAHVYYAGCSNLCIVADELIIPSQLKSLAIAVVVVFALLTALFRSVRYGLLALLPLILTMLIVFSLMAIAGVNLDSVTALVANIVLGIGVDYSVHFLSRYRRLRATGAAPDRALSATLGSSGHSILLNAGAVGIGFLGLVFSSFWPVVHIGWLVAANMASSAFICILLLPPTLGIGARHTPATAPLSPSSDVLGSAIGETIK